MQPWGKGRVKMNRLHRQYFKTNCSLLPLAWRIYHVNTVRCISCYTLLYALITYNFSDLVCFRLLWSAIRQESILTLPWTCQITYQKRQDHSSSRYISKDRVICDLALRGLGQWYSVHGLQSAAFWVAWQGVLLLTFPVVAVTFGWEPSASHKPPQAKGLAYCPITLGHSAQKRHIWLLSKYHW